MSSRPSDLRLYGVLAAGLLLAAGLVALSRRLPPPPPAPSGEAAKPPRFSAARAMRTVRHLSESIGVRPNGSPAAARAAQHLADELRAIPRVEVELQRARGVQTYAPGPIPFPPFVYQTINVVARIPGKTQRAVLLDAHYDTLTDSVGAGDDALGVAAIVEATRVLAAGPQLDGSVVILLNGAEEVGSLGAAAFIKQHRLAKDVRAYIYLDGGPGGKPTVIGAGPGNAWLLSTFAAAAPSPSATVVAQDLVESGLLPHSGDFRPFHDAGLVGIDLAAIGDFWAIHTDRDRAGRVDRATLQRTGESVVAATRQLASGPLPGNVDPDRPVYYDLLGLTVPLYSGTTARLLALLALALVATALGLALRRGALTPRQIGGAFGRLWLALLAAFVAALLAAALLSLLLGRPHSWYAAPWIAAWAFGASALAAALGVFALRRRCPRDAAPLAAWAAALLFWTLWLALLTLMGAGSGYLALWWAGPGALGLIGALLRPRLRPVFWLLAFLPGATLTLAFFAPVLPFLVAETGLIAAPQPLDLAVAALVALVALALLPLALARVAGARRPGRAALVCALCALAGLAFGATRAPYSVERPKRIRAALVVKDGKSALRIASYDALPLDPALRDLPRPAKRVLPWSVVPGLDPPFTRALPAARPRFAAPRIEVLSSRSDPARKRRTVTIRLVSDGLKLRLYIPRAPLAGWSLGALPKRSLDPQRVLVVFEGTAPDQRRLTLEIHGDAPVELELDDVRGPSEAPEIKALLKHLPPWTAVDTAEIWSVKERV